MIDELAPRLPVGGDVEWSASVDTIKMWVESYGGDSISPAIIDEALDAADTWNPGWAWAARKDQGRWHFKPKHQ